jgi:hypothetical protein
MNETENFKKKLIKKYVLTKTVVFEKELRIKLNISKTRMIFEQRYLVRLIVEGNRFALKLLTQFKRLK